MYKKESQILVQNNVKLNNLRDYFIGRNDKSCQELKNWSTFHNSFRGWPLENEMAIVNELEGLLCFNVPNKRTSTIYVLK